MSHEPALVPSSVEAREAAFQKDSFDRWMERVGVSHKPPTTPAQLAVPTPESAEPRAALLGLEYTSSLSSDECAPSGVQIPPPVYAPHYAR